jgi:hypothetical protein
MRFRKLRIAWSVFWGLACVLLIALWVRSYWWIEGLTAPISTNRAIQVGTLPGVVAVGVRHVQESLHTLQRPVAQWRALHSGPSQLWGGTMLTQSTSSLYIPYWPLILLSMIFAGVPWRKSFGRRFSLRTLLIATTLVAVVVGFAVLGARQ